LKNSKNEFKLKPEDMLILSCGHSQVNEELEKKIMKLVNLDLDWEYIVDMATRHRLRPLLYYNLNKICPDNVPEDVLVSLREFYHSNVRKNLMMTGELVKVMKLLEENGVNAVTYKGPVLAQMAYGNVGLREFGDLDILVGKSYALKAKDLMFSQGYKLIAPIKISDADFMKLEAEYIFINKKLGTKIEINWNFEGNFFSFKGDPRLLFDNQIKYNINDFEFLSFSTDNNFLMLSIHAAKHDWTRLSWIMDIAEFINKHSINWEDTLKKADKLGVKKILLITLYLTHELWDLELPDIITFEFDSKSLEKMVRKIKDNIFNEGEKSWNLVEKFFLDIEKRDDKLSGIKDSLNGLTKPTYTDFEDIPINSFLFFIYPILRPFLLIRRYGK
jgi:hypothetical protein